jgi:hypothetical protein
MPSIGPEPPHGALGEFRVKNPRPEVTLPNVEKPTKQPSRAVSQINPELPHGALGELRVVKQKSYPQRAQVTPPEASRPAYPQGTR